MKKRKLKNMVLVRWVGNNSKDYDGKEHYIEKEKMIESESKVGDAVRIRWYGKIWNGILVSDRKDICEEPIKKGKKERSHCKSVKNKPKTKKEKDRGKNFTTSTPKKDKITDVLRSKQWRLLNNKGPAALTRSLVKAIFTNDELLNSSFGGKKGNMFDPERISRIRDTVNQEFSIPACICSTVWNECRTSVTQMLKHFRKDES
ncbi:uncharacterized protein LOC127736723 [Mytilus californianus]|uniref:uncharacterized protein LOC127736723 n=1 Tax=Mytilus californianus TaxID=6549 RepID=UPI00224791AD|nr:uncharacterized protein LOC127736723 [Mytilus californianus]